MAPASTAHYEWADPPPRIPPIREAAMSDSPITDPLAWRPVKAPSLDLEILAGTVFAGLPEKFRALCGGLVIRVEDFAGDFAGDEVLDDMEIDDPFGLWACSKASACRSSRTAPRCRCPT
jgi:hypothetical protein